MIFFIFSESELSKSNIINKKEIKLFGDPFRTQFGNECVNFAAFFVNILLFSQSIMIYVRRINQSNHAYSPKTFLK